MSSAHDLVVVIPTRDRWPILRQTLDALGRQTATGFEVVVVVDGNDQTPPDLAPARVVVQEHGGPGKARNTGVRASDRPLVLFLGDDIVPTADLVRSHLALHEQHPEVEHAGIGHIDWHPSVGPNRIQRWMDWSGTQFDFVNIRGDDAGWGRFYSSNVSLKRGLFEAAGGFDEDFVYYYEDLDLAWRLHGHGLALHYLRDARGEHIHAYNWPAVVRRFEGIARGERMMRAKHDWFEPFFANRMAGALSQPPASPAWPALADVLARRSGSVTPRVRRRANRWYHQRLGPAFVTVWEAERDVDELREYLGDDFDHERLVHYQRGVEREAERIGDEATFYRTAESYLYDLTAFAMTGTKLPYHAVLRSLVAPGASLLDYGCGIGADGVRFLEYGYRVSFADYANPSTKYLGWRLARRGVTGPIYDLDTDDVPSGFDLAYAFDVIEHAEDPFAFLAALEKRAAIVLVNLLEEDEDDVHLHHDLPIDAIVEHARTRGLVHSSVHYGRSHLIAYRGMGDLPREPRPRRRPALGLERLLARRLPPAAPVSAVAGWRPKP